MDQRYLIPDDQTTRRRITPIRPRAEPNSQTAAGTGTTPVNSTSAFRVADPPPSMGGKVNTPSVMPLSDRLVFPPLRVTWPVRIGFVLEKGVAA